ncbi:hypothetical protein [Oceanotoga phage vB_OteS-UFV02]
MDWQEIIITVLIGLGMYLLDKYAKKVSDKWDWNKINEVVKIAVDATEQESRLKEMTSKEKFESVYDYVITYFPKLENSEAIKKIIEHYVFELNKDKPKKQLPKEVLK